MAGVQQRKTTNAMTGVNLGLIQYWFANKGGMEQHVLALSHALKLRGFNIRFFLAYPHDSANDYIAQLLNNGISITGPSSWIKAISDDPGTFKFSIVRFVVKIHCVYLLPLSLLVIGLFRGRAFRHRTRTTWKFMRFLDHDRPLLLSSVLKLCVSHCHKPLDVVHINGFRIEVGWAIRWADQFSVPCVYTEHSTVTDWLDFDGMDAGAVKLADCVTSVSRHACEELRMHAGLQEVAQVRHIFPGGLYTPQNRRSSSIEQLVCVAELKSIKRVSVLVEAFSRVVENYPHLVLHLVGDGPERQEITEYIDRSGIQGSVCLHGSLTNQEVMQLLQKSDLMILPSLSEGMPVSVLEALACGVPVIATENGGLAEIIRNGENGFLFSSGDSNDISMAIVCALESNADWPVFSCNARLAFEAYENKSFTAVDEIIDIYDQAIFNRYNTKSHTVPHHPERIGQYKLSVVIPTHNPKYIGKTLAGLGRQIEQRFEVLIIENGSSSSLLQGLILEYSDILHIRYHQLKKAGLNLARNYGTEKSEAEIVAFIDDDAIPDRWWTKQVLHAHRLHPDAGIIGGPVKLSFLSGDPGWIYPPFRDMLSEVDYGDDSTELEYPSWLAGTNFSFRKKIYSNVGAFLEDMGPTSENNFTGCNDETEFLIRASKIGKPGIYYSAGMVVVHLIPEERLNVKSLERRFTSQGYSDLLLLKKHETDISWRNWWKALYHALETDKWHRKLDDLPASLPLNARTEFYRHLVLTRIAHLEGMLRFILSQVASPEYVESISGSRDRYQKYGRSWSDEQVYSNCADDHMRMLRRISSLMLKKRFSWSLSDRFTEQCVFGRVFFFIEVKNSIKKQILTSE